MPNLMYDNMTDSLVTRDMMAKMPVPKPMGAHHCPYPFHEFVEKTIEVLDEEKFDVVEEEYAVTKDDNRLFGLMLVRPRELDVPND